MYTNCWCCDIPYDFPYSFEERNKIYLQCKQIPYWIWNEYDTTSISFDLEKLWKDCSCYPEIVLDDIDPETHNLEITFYNFRFEELQSFQKEFDKKINLDITPEITKDFPSGIYYCSLILNCTDESDPINMRRTILNKEKCLIYVR